MTFNPVKVIVGAPKVLPGANGSCLLHGEFHPMETECWEAVLDWSFDWEQTHSYDANANGGLSWYNQAKRDMYQLAVEQKMLEHIMGGKE